MIYVLYDDDADGFGACYAAQLKFGNECKCIAVNRGDPPPDMPDATECYILDFNYPRDVMKALQDRFRTVLIDHHISAEIELIGLPYCHFDTTKSACVLSWEYFWPDSRVPIFLQYIQDADLWQWRLPFSKQIRLAVDSYARDPETWRQISGINYVRDTSLEMQRMNQLVEIGEPILQYVRTQIAGTKPRQAVFVTGESPRISFDIEEAQSGSDRYVVPVVNATQFQSEIASNLISEFPNALFVAYYYDNDAGLRQWGLRSRPDGIDVSVIAKMFGGGGHRQAAGFRTFHDAGYGMAPSKPATVGALSAEEILQSDGKNITYAQ